MIDTVYVLLERRVRAVPDRSHINSCQKCVFGRPVCPSRADEDEVGAPSCADGPRGHHYEAA